MTPDLQVFLEAERAALARDDLDGAVEANVTWWVDGPHRDAGAVDPTVRDLVRQMQRRAFEVTAGWDDVEESALDLDAIHDAARRVADGIGGARRVDWPDVAHLPSMERPDDFLALLRDWLSPRAASDSVALDLYAGVPVSDYSVALRWYERLLGSAPTFVASATEAVWELAEHRSVVIEERPEHAGHALHTIFVDDLDALVEQIAARGLDPAERETYSNGVRKASYRDPDGNEIGFGGAPIAD